MASTPQERTTTEREPRATTQAHEGHAPQGTTTEAGTRPGRAIAALVLGIVALPAAIFPPAGILFGILAVVLGATARTDIRRRGLAGHGQATAGVVLGIVAIVVAIVLWVLGAIMVSS